MEIALGMSLGVLTCLLLWVLYKWGCDALSFKIRREQREIVSQVNERLRTINTIIDDLNQRVLELEKEE